MKVKEPTWRIVPPLNEQQCELFSRRPTRKCIVDIKIIIIKTHDFEWNHNGQLTCGTSCYVSDRTSCIGIVISWLNSNQHTQELPKHQWKSADTIKVPLYRSFAKCLYFPFFVKLVINIGQKSAHARPPIFDDRKSTWLSYKFRLLVAVKKSGIRTHYWFWTRIPGLITRINEFPYLGTI